MHTGWLSFSSSGPNDRITVRVHTNLNEHANNEAFAIDNVIVACGSGLVKNSNEQCVSVLPSSAVTTLGQPVTFTDESNFHG